jgi:hypothetical protein
MTTPNPFAPPELHAPPPPASGAPVRSPAWSLSRALPMALPATLLLGGGRVGLEVAFSAAPQLGWVLLVVGVVGSVASAIAARWIALWPACLVIPGALLLLSQMPTNGDQMALIVQHWSLLSADLVWAATVGAGLTWLWVGGQGGRRFVVFAGAIGLRQQAITLGVQLCLLPGFVAMGLLAMLDVVAARTDGPWQRWLLRFNGVWAIALGAYVLATLAGLGVMFLTLGVASGMAVALGSASPSVPASVAAAIVDQLVWGIGLALAAGAWDREG